MSTPGRHGAIAWEQTRVISFDCYGTLIDWERGILTALRGVLGPRGVSIGDEALLGLYARVEAEEERGTYRAYRQVLGRVSERIARELGVTLDDRERGALAASVGDWAAFEDTAPALRRLSTRFRLAVVSNIDDDLIGLSLGRIGVRFDAVVTAQQVGAYKPSEAPFVELYRRVGVPASAVLHAAQSRYHDIGVARRLGQATVWINRQRGRAGATPVSEARPDLEVFTLSDLADAAGV